MTNEASHLLLSLLLLHDVGVNALSDGELVGPLANLSQVSAGESLKVLTNEKLVLGVLINEGRLLTLVILARKSRSTSLATGFFLRLDLRMAILEPSSGSGM